MLVKICGHIAYTLVQALHVTIFFRWKSKSTETMESIGDVIRYVVYGTKAITDQNSAFTRMAVLEARAAKQMTKETLAFLPFMIFGFGFVLGM